MTDINKLIRLNVEIEGLLRVLADRDNAGVRESLAEKFAVYTEGMEALLNSGTLLLYLQSNTIKRAAISKSHR